MASASKGWLKNRVGLGGVQTGLASQAARRVSPGYFRWPSPAPSAPAGKHQRGEGNK
jgi:hypothetical protein